MARDRVFTVCCVVFSGIFIVLALLHHFYEDIGGRFLGVISLLFVTIAMIFNLILSYQATLLRSFKEEPYMIVSIIISLGLLIAFGILPYFNSFKFVMAAYMSVYVLVTVFIAFPIFSKFWRIYLNE